MEREFVPQEIALELKELGFDEPCFGYYSEKDFFIDLPSNIQYYTESIIAPTYSQAFRWFRENYNLRGFIGFRPNIKQFDCHVYDMSLSGKEYVKQRTMEAFTKDPKVGTYEEAELECLKKLIEIIKEKK